MAASSKTLSYPTRGSGLIVICGPTATGKSGLAIGLAQRLNSVILSADSRQVYREFNIGTAKPTLDEQKLVPHYCIDICDPSDTLTVAEYQQQAQTVIAQVHRGDRANTRGSTTADNPPLPMPCSSFPLLVGGTGLYIRAIAKGMQIPRVPPQEELRSQLQALGQVHCYALLQQVDPVAAEKIHPNDQVRTLRSLEVFYVTGLPMSQQQGENPPTYPILHIGLDSSDSKRLNQRIEQRTQAMVEAGFVAEVDYLCQKYGADLPLLNTLGYAEITQYLTGTLSLDAAQELTVLHTRQFAKRQRTWFRAYPEIEWFDADAPDLLEQVEQRVLAFIADGGDR